MKNCDRLSDRNFSFRKFTLDSCWEMHIISSGMYRQEPFNVPDTHTGNPVPADLMFMFSNREPALALFFYPPAAVLARLRLDVSCSFSHHPAFTSGVFFCLEVL